MKKTIRCFAVSTLLFLISCSTTQTTDTWVSRSYRGGPVSDILVIAVTKHKDLRRSFENKFVQKLQAAGVRAVASSAEMDVKQKLEKEAILSLVKKLGVDSVLVTHLISMKEKEVSTPRTNYVQADDYHGGVAQYYADIYDYSGDPQYSPTSVKVRLESKLYDVKTEKPIWSAQSKTIDPQSTMTLFDAAIAAFVKNLRQNKLLP